MAYRMGKPEADAARRVIMSGQLFRYGRPEDGWTGETSKFESEFARLSGSPYCVATTNGSSSLMAALAACGVGSGDEVIVPAYTYIATAFAVLACGAIPVITEVDETLTLDVEAVRKNLSARTRCIIPVHMIGLISDLGPLARLAREKGLSLIEDCCQGTGGKYQGRGVGTWGDMGAFSFNHYKTISAGEGGAVTAKNQRLFRRAMIYQDSGAYLLDPRSKGPDRDTFCGMNFRMNEVQAAILRSQLKRLPGMLKSMRAAKTRMFKALAGHKVCPPAPVHDLEGDCGKSLVLRLENAKSAQKLCDRLNAQGVPASSWFRSLQSDRHIYYSWKPVLEKRGHYDPRQDPYKITAAGRKIRYDKNMCPRTLDLLARSMTVNIHPDWTPQKTDAVLKSVESAAQTL
ncbi:MAG: DegT/DnrJ/EryC1/StrS family aminotransferase [candidate division FCPU426 bacterium]